MAESALARYGDHLPECRTRLRPAQACTCGYAAALADRLFNCPAGLECGPCRRLVGDLIAVAEAARELDAYIGPDITWPDQVAALRAALAALDARLAEGKT